MDHESKSPQEKKALSYAKDRRNGYGENAKASRKAIPRRKAVENRGNRRKIVQALGELPKLNETATDVLESSARHDVERVGGWKKEPDISLKEHLERRDLRHTRRD